MSQTIYQLGCLASEATCSYLTDRFGRKSIHILAHIAVIILGSATAMAQSYVAFVALRTATGYFVVVRHFVYKHAIINICCDLAF